MAIHRFVAPQKAGAAQPKPAPAPAPAPAPSSQSSASAPAVQPSGSERRATRRIDLEVEIGMESDHNFYTGLTRDISSGGIFVATGVTYDVGTTVHIKFTLPGGTELSVEAQVRWVRDPRTVRTDGAEGMGLRFINLTPEGRAAIAEFLDQRDSIFYDDE